jgi:hypothetical protein
MMSGVLLGWLLCGSVIVCAAQEPIGPGPPTQKDFDKRVEEYVKLRNTAREGLPKLKPTRSAAAIEHHEEVLAHRIREMRRGASQGDIFTQEISADFRKSIALTMQGEGAGQILESLRRADPVHLKPLGVNRSYPKGVPLQSTPPTLLLNLPKLPPDLEYRVVGRSLVLRDVEANLIVDFIPGAIPVGTNAP